MASHPPDCCCTKLQCARLNNGYRGTPSGTDLVINESIQGYLARPKDPDRRHSAIVYLPDIFGIWQNSKLMADAFASHGYTCLVLDLFNGDSVSLNMPHDFDIMGWFAHGSDGKNPHTSQEIDPIVIAGIKYLQAQGATQLAAVGYCIGAKYVIRHYRSGIDCGFIAHPSFVETTELAAITGPLSIAVAEMDDIFTPEKRHESEAILSEIKQPYQINLLSGVGHGFAVRCDLNDTSQRFAKDQAFNQAVAWFDRYILD
ncbi:unnamed protein product [Clonostachys rosea]|uniref:Dienelactone hydrolase domain-containing protein n=1 Tax=Bionectria ochroleuca TaxID=29856 RepID=A0ABY6UMB5_BIOOC|nr:unnamed protein product [Clonostachys rosea]